MSKRSIFQIIGIVTIINLASRLLGFIREVVIGYHFGTSYLADSVIIAYTIPNFLYIVVGGAVTTAFISIYQKIGTDIEKKEFKRIIFSYTALLSFIITALFMIFARDVIQLVFPGLSGNELAITADSFFFMAPAVVFLILSMWLSGVLNVEKMFYRTSLVTLVNNGLFVIVAIVFFPLVGALSYAVGAVAGAMIMCAMLMLYVWRADLFRFQFKWTTATKGNVLRFLKVAIPIMLGGATLQFYFLLHRVFAAPLSEGYVAALNYASKLVQLPQSILMVAVTTVIFPMLAKKVAEKRMDDVNRLYSKGMQQLLLLIAPFTVYLFFFAEEAVAFIFEYGSFTEQSTFMTGAMLKIFVIGMYAHAANLYVTRFYYAMEKSYVAVLAGVISVFGVNVAIIMIFISDYGASAIAWATTISAYFQLFSLIILGKTMLKLKLENMSSFVKTGIWMVAIVLVGWSIQRVVSFNNVYLMVIVTFTIFAIISVLLLRFFKLVSFNIRKRVS